MLGATTLSVIVGVSGLLGFLALVAYLYLVSTVRRLERSARETIEGEGLFNADQILRILEQFTEDDARLKALKTLTSLDSQKAEALLRKVRANVDVVQLQRLSESKSTRIAGLSAIFLLLLALLGYFYAQSRPAPPAPSNLNVIEPKWAISVPVPTGWSSVPCQCFVPSILPMPDFPLASGSFAEIPNRCRAAVDVVLIKRFGPERLPLVAREVVPVGAVLKADLSGADGFQILIKECHQ